MLRTERLYVPCKELEAVSVDELGREYVLIGLENGEVHKVLPGDLGFYNNERHDFVKLQSAESYGVVNTLIVLVMGGFFGQFLLFLLRRQW